MVKKTKLGEDIDLLLDMLTKMKLEQQTQNYLQSSTTTNVTQMVVYLESIISLLIKKEIFTRDEFSAEALNLETLLSVKRATMAEEARKISTQNHLNWLLTKSTNIGNA